jgi:glycosyltransferase involved in cell wall biosynthesis
VRVVIDGLAVRGENSLSIVCDHLLSGWRGLQEGDELHFVTRDPSAMTFPEWVHVHVVRAGRWGLLSRLWAQSFTLPRICREVAPDVLLGMIPSTAVAPLPCPRAVVAWDFRYRALPEQFRPKARWFRRFSYAIGFRQADGVVCISDRTRRDLGAYHPRTKQIPVAVAHLGADHVTGWPSDRTGEHYAIAFAHFANKNVDLVLTAWAMLKGNGSPLLPLKLVGVPGGERDRVAARVRELGLDDTVSINPWLENDDFHRQFASSSLVVFPSEYEGFGLPAVEAMRLGIAVVVTPDPALLEVTAGHATVVDGSGPTALDEAITTALARSPESIEDARRHAEGFTWAAFAAGVRTTLVDVVAPTTSLVEPSVEPSAEPSPSPSQLVLPYGADLPGS